MLILNPLKKLQKNSGEKSYQRITNKWQKNGVFDFDYCVGKFLAWLFFDEFELSIKLYII
jgi:hypothetical protein